MDELGGRAWRLHDRRTACLECGLEQAVADAGICARCAAPLPAAAHPEGSFPVVLAGGRVHDGLPGKDPGLYYDPAGEPGLREWTGTEWSSLLQVDPGAGGQPGQETGLATVWSPLSATELHRQSRAILRDVRKGTTFLVVLVGGPALFFILGAALNASSLAGPSRSLGLAAYLAALGVLFLVAVVAGVRQYRPERRIALALRAAAIRASTEGDSSAPASAAPTGTPEDRVEID